MGSYKLTFPQVRLTNDAVPVVVVASDADVEVPSNAVVQSPFTLTHGVDYSKYTEDDATEPFMRATITRFTKTGSTSIGFCTSHLIGRWYTFFVSSAN